MKKLMTVLLVTVLTSTFTYAADGQDKGLVGDMSVNTVSVDEKGNETFKKTTEVVPGETLEYKIVYTNESDHVFNSVSITGKIPEGTLFISGSASDDYETPLFTIDDGMTWAAVPVIQELVDGEIKTTVAPISSYTGVKWDVSTFLAEDQKVFTYRVKIEEE